jgi:hypothetical protein
MKPIREWKTVCPFCGQINIYPEFKGDDFCHVHNCSQCGTEYVCSSYKFDCATCPTQEQCIERPTVDPFIHRSTWRGWIHARSNKFNKLSWRDLDCVVYMRGEATPEGASLEDTRLQLAHNNLLVQTLKVGKPGKEETIVVWKSQPEPDLEPFHIHLGFFGRRKDA